MKKIFLVLTLIAISSIVSIAQDDYKKGEFYVGFSRSQVDTGINFGDIPDDPIPETQGFNGFEVSGVYNVSRFVGIKGDFSGAYIKDRLEVGFEPSQARLNANSSLYNVLGGVQIKDNSSKAKFKPFVHALAGAGIARANFTNAECPSEVCTASSSFGDTETGLA